VMDVGEEIGDASSESDMSIEACKV